MNYLEFHKQWHKFGCFNINQIYSWQPDFNRSNLNYWLRKKLLVKLRKEWYAFPDYLSVPDFAEYVANRIYRPSYISLQYAMSHYGMIPEAVMQITSVTSLKTDFFKNVFGEFFYQSVKEELMIGYKPLTMKDGRSIMFATPEKSLFDFIYLNPFYNTEEDIMELRLDEDFMTDDFDYKRFKGYCSLIKNNAFERRIDTLLKIYHND